jgi:NADPH-dependent 2,4-dienoyl-CoA reductase/sulfur reductase-like enzyme
VVRDLLADQQLDGGFSVSPNTKWGDGGWNRDKGPAACRSSFHETLSALWGFMRAPPRSVTPPAGLRSKEPQSCCWTTRPTFSTRTGQPIHPSVVDLHHPPYWHYDVLRALLVLTRAGYGSDPRMQAAQRIVADRRRPREPVRVAPVRRARVCWTGRAEGGRVGTTRLIVVGADAAGMSGAHQALRRARARGTEIEVIACGIPYWLAGDLDSGDDLVARTANQHRRAGVDLRLGTAAEELDLDAGTLTVRDLGSGRTERLGFDHVLLATGAGAITPPWACRPDGGWVPGVRAVKTLDDGIAWVDRLESGAGRLHRAVVVGGGYIGLEMAEAFLRRGLALTLITRNGVMANLDPDQGRRVQDALEAAGVEVLTGVEVGALVTGPDGAVRAVSTPDREIPADVVALGLGVRPRTEFAARAGLPIGARQGLQPDERQHVSGPVWAAGDCCEHLERHTGRRLFVPLGTHANKQGRVAGSNITGADERFGGVLGTAVTRFAAAGVEVEIGRTGPTLAQARDLGADVEALVTESTTASGYMPQANPVAVKVLADRRSRRLLGVQLVGGAGTA